MTLDYQQEAILEIASLAEEVNERAENIGARRLHTIMEKLLEEYTFEAPDMKGVTVAVTPQMVREKLPGIS